MLRVTGDAGRPVSTASLAAMPTALFLAVCLGCMAAAVRVLRGAPRAAAVPAASPVRIQAAQAAGEQTPCQC